MPAGTATGKSLEGEIARVLEIVGHVQDHPEGPNEADIKAAFINPTPSVPGWERR